MENNRIVQTGKVSIRNRFDITVEDIKTGEIQKYQAHNIVLNSLWTRLMDFNAFMVNIHYGTGAGVLSPNNISLFNHAGTKACETGNVEEVRALPVCRRTRKIVLEPGDAVGTRITEVGVAYSSTPSTLVTHALIEDAEGDPIYIDKTSTNVITFHAIFHFDLGEYNEMYNGQLRWVQPLTNNDFVSYLMGATYPTQQFRVTRAPEFSDGTAPGSHGQSANILVADWIKDAANKKVTTPVSRLGMSVGNGEVRGFGLGSSDTAGTFRGQFPITGVFMSKSITETIGAGDGVTAGFNLSWNDPQDLVIEVDDVAVDAGDYDTLPVKKGSNLFLFKEIQWLAGSTPGEPLTNLTDGNTVTYVQIPGNGEFGVDVGEAGINVDKFRVRTSTTAFASIWELWGSNNVDFSSGVLLGTIYPNGTNEWFEATFPEASYRYYRLKNNYGYATRLAEIELLTTADQITFHTPPANGAVVSAEYTVPYVPKDSNHVLDLQVGIQYGEPD